MLTGVLLLAAANYTFYNGNELHQKCSSSGSDEVFCAAYVAGISDMNTTNSIINKAPSMFCIPSAATVGQLKDVVQRFLEQNPQHRHLTASSLVIAALAESFPCSK